MDKMVYHDMYRENKKFYLIRIIRACGYEDSGGIMYNFECMKDIVKPRTNPCDGSINYIVVKEVYTVKFRSRNPYPPIRYIYEKIKLELELRKHVRNEEFYQKEMRNL